MRAHGRMMGKHRVRTVDDSILGAPLEVKLRWAVTPHAGMIRRGATSHVERDGARDVLG